MLPKLLTNKMVKVIFDKERRKWIELPPYSKNGFYMDGYLHKNLILYKKMVRQNRDMPFVISGMEGDGKTVLLHTILKFCDHSYNLKRCYMGGNDFLKGLIREQKTYKSHGLDEAQEFTSRDAMNKWTKKCIEVVSKIRAKQLYWGMAIPSFFELEKYLAIHRSRFLIYVYAVKGNRGYFRFYNWERKKLLYLKGKKSYDYNAVKPNFIGSFTLSAFPFKWDEYDKIKMESISSIKLTDGKVHTRPIAQRNILLNHIISELKVMSTHKTAKLLKSKGYGMDYGNIRQILQEFELLKLSKA